MVHWGIESYRQKVVQIRTTPVVYMLWEDDGKLEKEGRPAYDAFVIKRNG